MSVAVARCDTAALMAPDASTCTHRITPWCAEGCIVLLERERLAAVEGELSREIAVAFTLHLRGGLAQREYSRTYGTVRRSLYVTILKHRDARSIMHATRARARLCRR